VVGGLQPKSTKHVLVYIVKQPEVPGIKSGKTTFLTIFKYNCSCHEENKML